MVSVRKTLRFAESELEEVQRAMETTNEQWRGFSYFAREAILSWARAKNSGRRVRDLAAALK